MADITQLLANAADTKADFDFGKLNKSYFEGRDQFAKNELRDAFKDGVPMKDGQVDIQSVMKTLFQKGDIAGGVGLIGASAGMQDRALLAGLDKPQASPELNSPPSSNRGASVPVAPPLNRGGAQPTGQPSQAGSGQPGRTATLGQILTAQGIPNDQIGTASTSLARQLDLQDPNAPIDMDDPRVRNVLGPAIQQMKRSGIGQVVQNGNMPPQPVQTAQAIPQQLQPPQQAQAVPQQPMQQAAQPSPAQIDAQNDPILKRLTFLAASPDKATAAAAKVRLESYLKDKEATTEMKNAGASGMTLPQYQEKQGELASQQAGSTERAKADVKEQQEYIDQGRMAQTRLGTLNTISNIVSSDKNLNLGFGSETTLKVKMALEKAGMDFGDLSGAQLIQKLNGILASESSKSFSTRPTQFEFKTFLANNPGLALDEKGNVRMLGILAQNAKREADLGKLARQNRDNWDNWDNVVEKYDREHPIKDPTTGKALSNHSIIAPASPQAGSPPSSQQRFSSPSDVHAAVASGKLKSGDAFVDANGKTRYVP
jgi:hypothetical protein